MNGDDKLDFGPEDSQSRDEIEKALAQVTKKGQRRKNVRKAATTGGVVVVLALAVASLSFGSNPVESLKTTVVGSSHETTTTSTSTTSTTLAASKPSDGRPTTLVAYTSAGLVALDSQTGAVKKVLDNQADPSAIQLSPDAKTVYYDKGTPCSSIYKVSLEGGKPSLVVKNASDPALSADGKSLAYTTNCGTYAADVTNKDWVSQAIVVVNLAANKSHSIAEIRTVPTLSFDQLMWTHDGKYVVAATKDAEGQNTFQYDANVKTPVNMYGDTTSKGFEAPGFQKADGSKQPQWTTKKASADGSMLAITFCCKGTPATGPTSAVIVANGQITKTIATVQAGSKAMQTLRDLTSDGKHEYFAYTLLGANSDDELWVLDKGAKIPVRLATNVILVDWQ